MLFMAVQGLRTLDHRCDAQIDNPHSPLSIWPGLQDELTSNWLQAIIVRAFPGLCLLSMPKWLHGYANIVALHMNIGQLTMFVPVPDSISNQVSE